MQPSIIVEGVLEGLTTKISRRIVERFKDFLTYVGPNTEPGEYEVDLSAEGPLRLGTLNVVLRVVFNEHEMIEPYGEYSAADNTVKIFIGLGNSVRNMSFGERKGLLSALIPDIKYVIRHELEHVHQHYKGNSPQRVHEPFNKHLKSPDVRVMKWKSYMLQQHEIEAWVMGIYKKAKMNKVPLLTQFDLTLDTWKNALSGGNDKFLDIVLKEILSAWKSYARKRLGSNIVDTRVAASRPIGPRTH